MQWDLGNIKSLLTHLSGDRSSVAYLKEIADLKEALAKAIAAPKGDKAEVEAAELEALQAQETYEQATIESSQSSEDELVSTLDELLNQTAKRVGFGS